MADSIEATSRCVILVAGEDICDLIRKQEQRRQPVDCDLLDIEVYAAVPNDLVHSGQLRDQRCAQNSRIMVKKSAAEEASAGAESLFPLRLTKPLYLLKGAVYALEQCGLLLRDANTLFRGGSYANTVVQRGMLSITMRPTEKSAEAKLLRVRMETHPHSPEWQQADAELEKITQKLKKRTPNDRHQSRISALYVQPISDSEWNRPTETSASFAGTFLNGAVNDYSGRYHQGYIPPTDDPFLKHIDPELYGALELTPPVWPDLLQMF